MQCTVQGRLNHFVISQERDRSWKNKQTSVRSHRNGTVPEKTNYVISQEMDCSKPNRLLCHLTRKGPLLKQTKTPTKLSQQITKCEWISGTLSQHVAWLCDSRFLSQGFLYHPKRGQAVLLKDIQSFFPIVLETRPVLYDG